MNSKYLRILLLVVFIAVPAANFILTPILSDGSQFANDPQTRVAASGYAFAIWGVIFSGMLWFAGALVFGNEPDSSWLRKSIVCLIVAGLASIAFVPISIYCSFTIGWIDIMAHLIPLAMAAYFLRKHVSEVGDEPTNSLVRWSFFGPSMYFGWICAATVISTSLMANELGIELTETLATSLAIVTFLALGAVAIWLTLERDPIYGGTVCWALIAVGVKQTAFPMIQYSAWAVAAVIGVVVLKTVFDGRNSFFAVTVNQPKQDNAAMADAN